MNTLAVDLAKYLVAVPIVCALYVLWKSDKKTRKNLLILLVAGGILSLVLAKLGGHLYSDSRPFIKDGVTPLFSASHSNGFPSDHTLLASFLAFAILFYRRNLGIALLVIAAIVGWARVYGGVHHFIDILGSFIITAVSASIVYAVSRQYSHKIHAKDSTNSAEG